MRCSNSFCIYWEKHECWLDTIELDEQGTCMNCIYVDVDDEILEKKRNEARDRGR